MMKGTTKISCLTVSPFIPSFLLLTIRLFPLCFRLCPPTPPCACFASALHPSDSACARVASALRPPAPMFFRFASVLCPPAPALCLLRARFSPICFRLRPSFPDFLLLRARLLLLRARLLLLRAGVASALLSAFARFASACTCFAPVCTCVVPASRPLFSRFTAALHPSDSACARVALAHARRRPLALAFLPLYCRFAPV